MASARDDDISIAEAAAATTWQPGVRIDKFTLVGKIATGGMAEIWLARQAGPRGFEKLVVIKKILDSFTADDGFIEMFLDEARTAALLTHPNVVQIFDLGEFERSFFIAMEFIAGEHLARVSRASARTGKVLPLGHAARIVADAANGLHYAHTKKGSDGVPLNIVHRDVSPQNIMLTYDGVVKVLDFGVAKAANRSTQTEAGKFKGKIAYMAPEVARAEPFDARADVFALGIVLYELLGRCRLFEFDDPVEGVLEVSKKDPPIKSVREKNPEVPEDLAAIVAKALERDQKVRFQTARELAVALEDWLRTQPEQPEAAALAAYMGTLFSERIKKQNLVISELRASDSGIGKLRATPTGEFQLPGASGSRPGTSPKSLAPKSQGPLIAAGAVALLLIAGAGFGIARAVGDAKEEVKPPPPPPPAPSVLFVESEPPGATLHLDGKEVGTTPLTLPDVGLGNHALRATLEGFEAAERSLKIERAGERTNVLMTLKSLTEVVQVPPQPVDSAEPKQKGKLNVMATPWAEVYWNGRKLGVTPLVDVTLPAGKQTLKLKNPEKKLSKTITVEIKAGQTTSLKSKL